MQIKNKILIVGNLFQMQYTKFLQVKTDTDSHPSKSVRRDTSPPPRWSDHSEQHNSTHLPASTDLTREADNTFISTPCHLTMWHLPLWRYSSIVAVSQMWNSGFYHPVLGKEERSGRWRERFPFNLDPPKWKETECWQACESSTAGSTGELQRPV